LKVSILAWQQLRDKLPTKTNLLNRGILSSEAAICFATCGQTETAPHYSGIAIYMLLCERWFGLG